MKSSIESESSDGMTATLKIESDCPAVLELAAKIETVDAVKEVFAPFGSSIIFKESTGTLPHATCPVPTAILKTVEAACSLALPADVNIEIKKAD